MSPDGRRDDRRGRAADRFGDEGLGANDDDAGTVTGEVRLDRLACHRRPGAR